LIRTSKRDGLSGGATSGDMKQAPVVIDVAAAIIAGIGGRITNPSFAQALQNVEYVIDFSTHNDMEAWQPIVPFKQDGTAVIALARPQRGLHLPQTADILTIAKRGNIAYGILEHLQVTRFRQHPGRREIGLRQLIERAPTKMRCVAHMRKAMERLSGKR